MARITQRDNGKWQAKIERVGWPGQSKTFRLKKDADAWATAVEREMDRGAFINRDDAERTTFEAAAGRYAAEVLPSKRGVAQDTMRVKRLVEKFGKYSLASISSAMVAAYRDERLKVVSPQTVVHELGMISRIFKACAMDWGIALPHGNPAILVRKPAVANERTRRLQAYEETLLLTALLDCKSPWPHAAVCLALETAGRQSELLSMKWKEIDLVKRTARLRGIDGRITKSGDEYRDVPLSTRAVNLLDSLPRTRKANLVPINKKQPSAPIAGRVLPITQSALQLSFERGVARGRQSHIHGLLRKALSEAGLSEAAVSAEIRALIYKKKAPLQLTLELLSGLENEDKTLLDLHFHDLRHEATSRLADKLQMHELMKVTGHKTSRMISRYYHPRAEDLAKKLG
ncbi:MAG: tyrosine-type recombinase/integrase [Polaromonas sp.]|nr:tyrosine-type recombinase/integrase [Polaromonas sp.]